jgi:hypothetical protein
VFFYIRASHRVSARTEVLEKAEFVGSSAYSLDTLSIMPYGYHAASRRRDMPWETDDSLPERFALSSRATSNTGLPKRRRGEKGRLTPRVRPSGLKEFYYRKRRKDGDQTIRIGRFEQTPGYGGITLDQALSELKKLVAMKRTTGNFRSEVERQKEAEVRTRLLEERAARAGTFEQMIEAYVGDLRARERVSARDVGNAFQRHMKKPFPKLCSGLAKAVSAGDIHAILAKLVQKGIRRGVNLLRSHLNAAFQYAAKADNDPTGLAHDGAVFEILANPVALVPRKTEFETVGERHLSPREYHRTYPNKLIRPSFSRWRLA